MYLTQALTHDLKSFEKIRKNRALRQLNPFEFLTHIFWFLRQKNVEKPCVYAVFRAF